MLRVKKINNAEIKPIPKYGGKQDNRPILGADYFDKLFCNIYICARKESGKTTTIFNILENCANENTTVIAFVGTLYADDSWENIRIWCDDNGINFIGLESIIETDEETGKPYDELNRLVTELKLRKKYKDEGIEELPPLAINLDVDEDKPVKRKRKNKFRSPEFIFVLDDLSTELQAPSIARLMKEHRHIKSKVIISTQSWKDLKGKGPRNQLDYVLIFKGLQNEILKEIYENINLNVSLDEFLDIYKLATNKDYSFLYIDRIKNKYRICFNEEIQI